MPVRVGLARRRRWAAQAAGSNGHTFNAAGDFDRLIGSDANLPMWSSLTAEENWTFESEDVAALVRDLDALDARARHGPEERGLLRLARLPTLRCATRPLNA